MAFKFHGVGDTKKLLKRKLKKTIMGKRFKKFS